MWKLSLHDNVVSGSWKFDKTTPLDELAMLAAEWKNGSDGERFPDLHVRTTWNDYPTIVFQFVLDANDDNRRKVYGKFRNEYTDKLKRRFGNDFKGWDITYPTYAMTEVEDDSRTQLTFDDLPVGEKFIKFPDPDAAKCIDGKDPLYELYTKTADEADNGDVELGYGYAENRNGNELRIHSAATVIRIRA